MFNSINDAKTALINSGVCEMFDFDKLDAVAEKMYREGKSPEEVAAELA